MASNDNDRVQSGHLKKEERDYDSYFNETTPIDYMASQEQMLKYLELELTEYRYIMYYDLCNDDELVSLDNFIKIFRKHRLLTIKALINKVTRKRAGIDKFIKEEYDLYVKYHHKILSA